MLSDDILHECYLVRSQLGTWDLPVNCIEIIVNWKARSELLKADSECMFDISSIEGVPDTFNGYAISTDSSPNAPEFRIVLDSHDFIDTLKGRGH